METNLLHLSRRGSIARFATLLLAALLLAVLAPRALADPAMWRVDGPHMRIYLFGTVHVLRPDQRWQTPALQKALAGSDGLWLEIADVDARAQMQGLVQRFGRDPANPLSERLDKDELARLDKAAHTLGIPGGAATLDTYRPWAVGLTLSVLPEIKAGYARDSGVDLHLKAMAAKLGKPVHGLETMSQQVHFFADMKPDTERAFLDAALDDIDHATARLDALVDAWAAGDVESLARQVRDGLTPYADSGLYDLLIRNRNRAWVSGQLEPWLRGGRGVRFVAVGAGHLAGADGVPALLRKDGFRVQRIQ